MNFSVNIYSLTFQQFRALSFMWHYSLFQKRTHNKTKATIIGTLLACYSNIMFIQRTPQMQAFVVGLQDHVIYSKAWASRCVDISTLNSQSNTSFPQKNSVEATKKKVIFCFLAAEENYIAAKFCRNNLYANFIFQVWLHRLPSHET